jgi:hypothetical protein
VSRTPASFARMHRSAASRSPRMSCAPRAATWFRSRMRSPSTTRSDSRTSSRSSGRAVASWTPPHDGRSLRSSRTPTSRAYSTAIRSTRMARRRSPRWRRRQRRAGGATSASPITRSRPSTPGASRAKH